MIDLASDILTHWPSADAAPDVWRRFRVAFARVLRSMRAGHYGERAAARALRNHVLRGA